MIGLHHAEATQQFRDVAQQPPQFPPIERNLLVAQQCLAARESLAKDRNIAIVARDRHARRHAAVHFEQFELEIDGRRQLGLTFAKPSKLDDLTGL